MEVTEEVKVLLIGGLQLKFSAISNYLDLDFGFLL